MWQGYVYASGTVASNDGQLTLASYSLNSFTLLQDCTVIKRVYNAAQTSTQATAGTTFSTSSTCAQYILIENWNANYIASQQI